MAATAPRPPSIPALRERILGTATPLPPPTTRSDLLGFLGHTRAERVETLLSRIIPGSDPPARALRARLRDPFTYIVDFWGRSILQIPYGAPAHKGGVNLARRPFCSPSGPVEPGTFTFLEQYRWDTFFQNHALAFLGGHELAIGQLLNFVDVFGEYRRIPNALNSGFLSHAQPPLEALGVADLLSAGAPPGEWTHQVIEMVERDLVTEWWDQGNGAILNRQTDQLVTAFGPVTRHVNVHFHPLLVGCEDGKDHNWVTMKYGSSYLPVQLNAIIYGALGVLADYYGDGGLGDNQEKAATYTALKDQLLERLRTLFWCGHGKWRGFRNYAFEEEQDGTIAGGGHILYGDLAAEVWPLFVKAATQEQAEVTRDNLRTAYAGDYGLAVTSRALREGGSIESQPPGQWGAPQWELNCWPPIMYVATTGLRHYGFVDEALGYESRWTKHVEAVFGQLGGFPEKTASSSQVPVAEGFYGNLKGFGWTIAVYLSYRRRLAQAGVYDL